MADSSVIYSDFDGGDSSDGYAPKPKAAKAAPAPKKAAAVSKPKPAPKKLTQTSLKSSKAPKKRPTIDSDSDGENSDGAILLDETSMASNTPPSAKRQKKAAPPKKSSGKPLQEISNESFATSAAIAPEGKKKETYQKLTQVEHILKRPDTYIGSVERMEQQMWVYNSTTESMESRKVSFVPGLYKIFDEILVNAADNKQRDKNMDEIRVSIDREKGEIIIRNNGRGIPVEINSQEGVYNPELIFGHLLTSSNYDDDERKTTGGRNGFGAKLCNIYSTKFVVETQDSQKQKRYSQTWTDNMSNMQKPKITANKTADFTQITFYPDFRKFGMENMDEDFEALVKRRVYDMAGTCRGVKVLLNGDRIKVRNFKQYMEMYTKSIKTEAMTEEGKDTQVIITDNPHERWEVGFAVSDGSFQQISFVNSIATTVGGTHVNLIADQIVDKLMATVAKRNKGGVKLKPNQIKNHMFLFVNCLIDNPAFTSQTKEQMTTKQSQFGSKPQVSPKFLKEIEKTEVVNNILHFAQAKADQALKKSDGSRRSRMNHSKLTDANKAGTKDGHRCTLILTEGDSASLLALAGRAVLSPDEIGVFPLRGKLLNVRDASVDQISKNQEIQNIKKFMGLQHKKHYDDVKSLRYGSLMIMTDQDHDGSHIKGLLINLFEVQFPSLLKIPGFLKEFITPIVKVWKGDPKNPKQPRSFFTMPEYEKWKLEPGHERGWFHKYYKGLGTSSPSDAEVYFADLDMHLKVFDVMKPEEPQLIDLAFSKKKADNRKEWLRNFVPGTYLDMTAAQISYTDFINKELILFSMADNERSIPSVLDGFKPGQRKVLYTCFRRNLKHDVKVVELAGSVSGLTAYAYGDTSMQQTITGMAQTFVGSNNINTLEPSGNFGSRLQGGQDCASARYIYTRLSPFARKIFKPEDEPLLECNTDDGKLIEPKVYMPVVPMILINGADGIGTGWSTSIPNYNPVEVVDNLLARMQSDSKDAMTPMKPWFRGWKNNDEIEDLGNGRFKFSGTIEQTTDNEVVITELPVRMWTQDFKDRLEDIMKTEKGPSFIKDYHEYNTPVKVHFVIKLDDKNMSIAVAKGLKEQFKLEKTMATTNLVAFDRRGQLMRYETPLDIMEEFYHARLEAYHKRKAYMIDQLQHDVEKLSNQARFVQMIVDGKLVVSKKKKTVLVAELKKLGFKSIAKMAEARKQGEFEAVVEQTEGEDDSDEHDQGSSQDAHGYDYLLGMAIWSLTEERIRRLLQQKGDKETELLKLQETPVKSLWRNDLEAFREEWHTQLADEEKRAKERRGRGRRVSAKLGGIGKASRKRKPDDDYSDDDYAVSKPKSKTQKTAPLKSKSSSLAEFFKQPEPEVKVIPKPIPKVVGATGSVDVDMLAVDDRASKKSSAPPTSKPKKKVKAEESSEEENYHSAAEDDEDVFAAVAKEAKAREASKPVAGGRQARTAARKPVTYMLDEDSSDQDMEDLLGDVSNMVKGIPNAANGIPSKALFAESTSRPGSSGGPHGRASSSKPRQSVVLSDIEDETNYVGLVPKDSPQKPAARNAREHVISDDEEDSFVVASSKPVLKTTSKVVPKPKKAPAVKEPIKKALLSKQEPKVLSPAAKAYAAKQAKAKAATGGGEPTGSKARAPKAKPPSKKKSIESEEDDDDQDVLMVDDDEDDDDDEEPIPAARPSRRAAATAAKSKYMPEEESDDVDEEPSEEDDEFDSEADDD